MYIHIYYYNKIKNSKMPCKDSKPNLQSCSLLFQKAYLMLSYVSQSDTYKYKKAP